MEFFNFFRKNDIGEPPWEYDFLVNLPESEYPKYLAKIFNYRTGEKLPLRFDFRKQAWIIDKKRCKTFNQKIQWIKLYGVTDLMRMCTDKVAVRDYVKEKIGEEYLKPVLQICDIFDEIDFERLPKSFVLKCNHGSKWQYIIKDKKEFLQNKQLFEIVKRSIIGWLEQDFFPWNGFEMQYATSRRLFCREKGNPKLRFMRGKNYLPDTKRIIEPTGEIKEPVLSNKYELRKGCHKKGIEPKILIEPLMRDDININCEEIQLLCFSGKPNFLARLIDNEITFYDDKLNIIDNILCDEDILVNKPVDNLLQEALILSRKLSNNFNFVRVDFMIYKNKLYFEELTFTPHSGLQTFINSNIYLDFSHWLQIGDNYEF